MDGVFATEVEKLESCVRPFSFFSLIETLMPEGNSRPLHRFCTLMRKMNAQSFVMEDLELDRELSDEQQMLQVYAQGSVDYMAKRLTFFGSSWPLAADWSDTSVSAAEHVLGYIVIANFKLPNGNRFQHVLEAVVKPPCTFNSSTSKYEPVPNYYVHNVRSFRTVVGTRDNFREIIFLGSFFTQQNQMTSVCAHACLRMALNSSPLLTSNKLTNKEINDILGISSYNVSGLNQDQIKTVVESRGFTTHSADFTKDTRIEYDHFLYPALESCFPTILGIQWWDRQSNQPTGHVVTVLGHTSNFDRWKPEADRGYGNFPLRPYISSAEWCDHYVISDDNYGMYSALPSEAMRNFVVPGKNPNPHASMAVTIVPQAVTIRGYWAEQVAVKGACALIEFIQLPQPQKWFNRLKNRRNDGAEIVCRTLLQTKQNYVHHILTYNSNLSSQQRHSLDNLPEYVWVTEISLPNLYSANKTKLGDVVIRANATQEELTKGDALCWAWLPGFVQLENTTNFEKWEIVSHIPLIRNIPNSTFEW